MEEGEEGGPAGNNELKIMQTLAAVLMPEEGNPLS